MNRNIIHIHIPAFPITMERMERPELRGRPVVVAPPHSERAVILSASPEARREGIFKGMALGRALKFCPDLSVLHPNPILMEKGCQALSRAVSRYTPLWEPVRPGHIYMDVTGTKRLWGRAKDTAGRIIREIKEGMSLTGTVGVAGNKMVSSIASILLYSKGGVMDVDHGKEPAFMAPLRVDYLPGIGHVRRRMLLEELNVSLVREIAVMDPNSLRLVFGRQALVIHQRALGIDPRPVTPPTAEPSVIESITLPHDENDDHKILGIIYYLVERCSLQMRNRGLLPRIGGLMIRYSDQIEVSRQIGLDCHKSLDLELYYPMEKLFHKACVRRTGIRSIRVWLKDFCSPSSQLPLFPPESSRMDRDTRVTRALDRIRERHGEKAIRYGRTADIFSGKL